MTSPSRLTFLIAFALRFAIASAPSYAQDPPKPEPKSELPAKPEGPVKPAEVDGAGRPDLNIEVKPLPLVAIPDDPPPHEGAFFDLPLTIQPPDVIIVELLEALPGRPITGERLVRPDGTISLGFYGDIHVRGLTIEQAKVKIILHLRRYIIDEVLGLVIPLEDVAEPGEMPEGEMPGQQATPVPNGRNPFEPEPPNRPGTKPEPPPADEVKPETERKPEEKKPGRLSSARSGRSVGERRTRRARLVAIQDPSKPGLPENPQGAKPQDPAKPPLVPKEIPQPQGLILVAPADSQRVFVDFAQFNHNHYYVQGDVGVPGRVAFTGGETVLDALNYAGGLLPSSEPFDVHLHRPARGGKPAKDYKIDLDAIRKGVATANYQMFPNDRLVVGRNPIVTKTTEVDRAGSLINSLMNSILQYSFMARSMAVVNSPPSGGTPQVRVDGQNVPVADPPAMTPARRDALVKEWVELLWSISSREGGAMLDEKAFKEALMKKLTPAPEPK